jgi:hypothetical protein
MGLAMAPTRAVSSLGVPVAILDSAPSTSYLPEGIWHSISWSANSHPDNLIGQTLPTVHEERLWPKPSSAPCTTASS